MDGGCLSGAVRSMTRIKAALEQEEAMGRPRKISAEERADLLAKGYTPIEIWVPDRDSDIYRQEAARQSRAAAKADKEAGIIEFHDEDRSQDWEKP
jgi:hypothetical protein